MKKKAEILIIDDLSPNSNLAIEAGINWSIKLNCKPTLVNFERSDTIIDLDTSLSNKSLEEYIEDVRTKEKTLILKKRPRFFKERDVEPHYDFSNDIENIVSKASQRKSKMIIISYSDSNSKDRLFSGSVLDKLIEETHIPILIIKNKSHLNPQKILMAFDIKDVALDALEFSSIIASFSDKSIVTPLHLVNEDIYKSMDVKDLKTLETIESDARKASIISKIRMRINEFTMNGRFMRTQIVNKGRLSTSLALLSSIKSSESELVILGKSLDKSFFKSFKKSEVKSLLDEVDQSLLIVKPFH